MLTKREFLRYNTTNLVYYTLYNGNSEICGQGAGRTLNISKSGILLQIDRLFDDEIKTLDMDMALANVIITIKGRVVYTRKTGENSMEAGIQFIDVNDEIRKKLSGYIIVFFEEAGKTRNLIRENVARIDNVVLTLSKEHKIINDYVIGCRKMFERAEHEFHVQDLDTLFDFMQKDLIWHFNFEEHVIFEAALSGEKKQEIEDCVRELHQEHDIILEKLTMLTTGLKMLIQENKQIDSVTKDKIDSFMGLIKRHARNEMEKIFPVIDSDNGKMRVLNHLLVEHNSTSEDLWK